VSYRVYGEQGYRVPRQNGGYRKGPGQGYQRGSAAAAAPPFEGGIPETILGVTPYARYYGADATLAGWPAADYGEDLTYWDQTPGDAPTTGVEGLYEYADGVNEGVTINSNPSYQADTYRHTGDQTYWAFGDDDIWLKLIWKVDTSLSGLRYIISKRVAAAGFSMHQYHAPSDYMFIHCGGTQAVIYEADGYINGAWIVVDFVYDNGAKSRTYLNSAVHTAAGNANRGTLGDASDLVIGANQAGGAAITGTFAFLGIWRAAAGWLASHDQDTLVAAHYAQLIG